MFKPGDRVRCIDPCFNFGLKNTEYTVSNVDTKHFQSLGGAVYLKEVTPSDAWGANRFVRVQEKSPEQKAADEYRASYKLYREACEKVERKRRACNAIGLSIFIVDDDNIRITKLSIFIVDDDNIRIIKKEEKNY